MKNLLSFLRSFLADPVRGRIGLHAAAGAYYLFLSLGPFIALLLALVPHLPLPQTELPALLLTHTPEAVRELVYLLLSRLHSGSLAALGLSLTAELWSAGKFFSGLLHGLCEIYDGEHIAGFLRRRLFGVLYTLALLAFIVLYLALRLWGESLLSLVQRLFPALEPAVAAALGAGPLLFPILLTLAIALLFRWLPRRRLPFLPQLPGAAAVTAGWFLFSRAYSFLVERFRFFSVYGSLAIVFLSLFWMYGSLYILFLGAWLNTRLKPFPRHQRLSELK